MKLKIGYVENCRNITMPSWCTSTFSSKRIALSSIEAGTIIPAVLTPFPWRTSCKRRGNIQAKHTISATKSSLCSASWRLLLRSDDGTNEQIESNFSLQIALKTISWGPDDNFFQYLLPYSRNGQVKRRSLSP